MKVNILSPGRFHVCDLARELDAQGFDVRFYSYVLPTRAARFGLPKRCSSNWAWALLPFIFMERKAPWCHLWWVDLRRFVQDGLTSLVQRDADVTIAMSGEFNRSVAKAKRRGSVIICERGSKHILDQKRILDENPGQQKSPISASNVERELLSYELADYISVGAEHVERSFLQRGFSKQKLFVNPYGVELGSFHPILNEVKPYDFLMVGTWSYQKGCDLITEAIRKTNYRFLHVGSLGDTPFPQNDSQFVHIDPVDQLELIKYYAQSKVFVLPSRQDGLAMVLVQAIACGLPIVASQDGGACDLKKLVDAPDYISIVDGLDADSLTKAMVTALELQQHNPSPNYAGSALNQLTWQAYGSRYAQFLRLIIPC